MAVKRDRINLEAARTSNDLVPPHGTPNHRCHVLPGLMHYCVSLSMEEDHQHERYERYDTPRAYCGGLVLVAMLGILSNKQNEQGRLTAKSRHESRESTWRGQRRRIVSPRQSLEARWMLSCVEGLNDSCIVVPATSYFLNGCTLAFVGPVAVSHCGTSERYGFESDAISPQIHA